MTLKIYILNTNDISVDALMNSPYISEYEKPSFDKFKNEMVKKEKIASSIFKNKYIGEYRLNEFGKPVCDDKHFNISHSHGYVVFVMDTVQVGVDIETIRPVKKELSDYTSNEEEKAYIRDEETFYEVWTNKEALVKADGHGIRGKVNLIPALPLNGVRSYNGQTYRNITIKYKDYIITVSRQNKEDYSLDIVEEIDK